MRIHRSFPTGVLIGVLLLSLTLGAGLAGAKVKEENSGKTTDQASGATADDVDKSGWTSLYPEGDLAKIMGEVVTNHLVQNNGTQDFYQVSEPEIAWLDEVNRTRQEWQSELLRLEIAYRTALSQLLLDKVERHNRNLLRKQYTDAINRLHATINQRNQQIAERKNQYIKGLGKLSFSALVVVRVPFTKDLAKRVQKHNLTDHIFLESGKAALQQIRRQHMVRLGLPVKEGLLRKVYLYPENISRYDAQAREYVYLFQRVEVSPFALGRANAKKRQKTLKVMVDVLSTPEEVAAYLTQEGVGDERLRNWIASELAYHAASNRFVLGNTSGRLQQYENQQQGLRREIAVILDQIDELVRQKKSLKDTGAVERSQAKLDAAGQAYRDHYSRQTLFSFAKYTIDLDTVYFSNRPTIGIEQSVEVRGEEDKALKIPISNRDLKTIFQEMMVSASQTQRFNTKAEPHQVFKVESLSYGLIKDQLKWTPVSEEFRILKLGRGNIGSRTQYVVHLALRSELAGSASFPMVSTGVCDYMVFFDSGSHWLTDKAKEELEKTAGCLRKYPEQTVYVRGHTDSRHVKWLKGRLVSNNVDLAMRRAGMVFDYLRSLGFDPRRFELVSFGARQPAQKTGKDESVKGNRRVQILSRPKTLFE